MPSEQQKRSKGRLHWNDWKWSVREGKTLYVTSLTLEMGEILQIWGTNRTASSSDWGIQLFLRGIYKYSPWTGENVWPNTVPLKPNQTWSSDLFMKMCCSRGAFRAFNSLCFLCVSGWHYLWSWAQLLGRCHILKASGAVPDVFPWTMWTWLNLTISLVLQGDQWLQPAPALPGKRPSIKNFKLPRYDPITAFFQGI